MGSDYLLLLQHLAIALHCPLCVDGFLYIRFWSQEHFNECCIACGPVIREWHIYTKRCPVQSLLPRLTTSTSDCQICHLKLVVLRQHFSVYEARMDKLCQPCQTHLRNSVEYLENDSCIKESVAKKCKVSLTCVYK